MNAKGSGMAQVFRVPILLGGATIIGLGAALAGDGWLDVLSWFALGVPVAVILYAVAWPAAAAGEDRHRAG